MENGKEHILVSIEESDLNELKREIRNAKAKFGAVISLLILLVLGLAYISFVTYRQTNSSDVIDSHNRVLLVQIGSDYSKLSDAIQVKNALKDGGMIRLELDKEFLEESFGSSSYQSYGATNSEGYHYILGALLNYIASRGWNLIQGPSSGLSDSYYFAK